MLNIITWITLSQKIKLIIINLINFALNNSILITIILLGIILILLFSNIIDSKILLILKKKYFLKKIKLKEKETEKKELNNKKWWKGISFLENIYQSYLWAQLPFSFNFLLLASLGLFISSTIIFSNIFTLKTSFSLALILTILYFLTIRILAKKNKNKISKQLPFVLETLSGSIQSGYSLPQAIKFTHKEIGMPMEIIFQEIIDQMNYNIPLSKIFRNIQNKTANKEFKIVLDGLIMQNKMGGDIIKMLKQMSFWIRQKNKLKRDIKIFTSQGRLSGIIIILLWPISALAFYLTNANYISILFVTSLGKFLLFTSFILEFIGFYMIWKIVKIRI